MLVNVLVEIVEKARKELGEYLYKNDELDWYVCDVIAADGKETHNTAKRNSVKDEDRKNLQEFNVISTEWGIWITSLFVQTQLEISRQIRKNQQKRLTVSLQQSWHLIEQFDVETIIFPAFMMNAEYCLYDFEYFPLKPPYY